MSNYPMVNEINRLVGTMPRPKSIMAKASTQK